MKVFFHAKTRKKTQRAQSIDNIKTTLRSLRKPLRSLRETLLFVNRFIYFTHKKNNACAFFLYHKQKRTICHKHFRY